MILVDENWRKKPKLLWEWEEWVEPDLFGGFVR
ncbi:hypothetical protein LCGC14_0671560 [marine sediment metagenome]|uniref:Uncharacterized protein n=1 Tax=marine sediment metagenome TaxID=412755 RepID=A0A0F9RB14_9ZZZZ